MGSRREASARGDAEVLSECLAGRRLWGDDFDAPAIGAWYRDEQEAYSGLVTLGAGG